MRSYQVFSAMSPERAIAMMKVINEELPSVYSEALQAACIALKARPVYLKRQPFDKRAEAIRRALARVASNSVADEMLAVYFLQCRKDLLVEWLDTAGIEHEDGGLADDEPEAPADRKLIQAIDTFRAAADDPDRELLLHAFAAQEAIDWPTLETQLAEVR